MLEPDTGGYEVLRGSIYLFGVHSPLVVDYEETISRLNADSIPVLVDDADSRCSHPGLPIRATQCSTDIEFVTCAFMPPRRTELVSMAASLKLTPALALIDPSAVIASTSELAQGTFCNAGVTIGGLSSIGEHAVINRSSSIGHHVLIDDFVSLGPSVTLSGGVIIGEGSMIGGGSVILPGITIGENAIVAAGSVVTENVPNNTMVAGVPAKIKKEGNVFSGVHIHGEE